MKSISRAAITAVGTWVLAMPGGLSAQAVITGTPADRADLQVRAQADGIVHRTLANGLEVFSIRDPYSASVSAQVWYKVGSVHDPEGRSGFAHMFEHMMFKASRNLPPGSFERLTGEVGGDYNAATAFHVTNYFTRVPASYLEGVLFAEADRMGSLIVDKASFESEREVVKEELRSRTLGTSYGKFLAYHLPNFIFRDSPYRRTGIGSMEQLDAASIEELSRFHHTFYRPDNAALIVAGNFDQAQLDAWIDRYFGKLQKPDRAIPRLKISESFGEAREATFYGSNVPEALVQITWPTIPYAHRDRAALTVMASILTNGRSSRLNDRLVYRDEIATLVSSENFLTSELGTFMVRAMVRQGNSIEQAEAVLRDETGKLVSAKVDAGELEEAKAQLLSQIASNRETALGRAYALGNMVILGEGSDGLVDETAAIEAVTIDDVWRVARTYLRPDRAMTARYVQASTEHPETPLPVQSGGILTVADLATASSPAMIASEAERLPMPGPGASVTPSFPAIEEGILANGLRVVVADRPGSGLINLRLEIGGGAFADPAGKSGVASITAGLLTHGAGSRDAGELASQVERLGAYLGAVAEKDQIRISSSTTSTLAPQLLDLIADVALRPHLSDADLDREKNQASSRLKFLDGQARDVAELVANHLAYGASPYRNRIYGSDATLGAIGMDDVRRFHERTFRPGNATLVIAGDIRSDQGFRLARAAFGEWPGGTADKDRSSAPSGDETASQVLAVDLPGSPQAAVVLSMPGPRLTDPDYFSLLVANEILGGGFAARLNQEIRIKRGLSYGASSKLEANAYGGVFRAMALTRNEAAADVAQIMLEELARLAKEDVPESELAARKTGLVQAFSRSFESSGSLSDRVSAILARDMNLADLGQYRESIEQVTAQDIRDAVGRRLAAERANIVIAGDLDQFIEGVRGVFPGVVAVDAEHVGEGVVSSVQDLEILGRGEGK